MRLIIARNFIGKIFASLPIWAWICFSGLLGSILSIGLYTFIYAHGFSYISNDPKACVNCHVMRDVYDGWNHSSHKSVATCNDCHVPHNFLAKYAAKGLNGWHHSVAFTTGDFKEPIRIKKHNKEILKQNCMSCHGTLVDPVIHKKGGELDCLHCHSRIGHAW